MTPRSKDQPPAARDDLLAGQSTPVKKIFGSFITNLVILFVGVLLFAASFPNLLIENGLSFLAWFMFIPVFWVIRRSNIVSCFFWGAIYGYASYGLFNYWLSVFHPLAGLIVNSIYLVFLALLFPLLKLAVMLYPRRGYILQWLIWIGFEFFKTQGFLGYAYGISGYTQWTVLPLIQIASITGVWGVSALVVFPSAWLAGALDSFKNFLPRTSQTITNKKTRFFSISSCRSCGLWLNLQKNVLYHCSREWIPALVWFVLLVSALVYGFISPIKYENAPKAKIALIQHNTDPWKGGIDEYRDNYRILKYLSEQAISANPDLDLVVWSETAFVPRIYWHTNYRDDPASWLLIRELLEYLASRDVPFVIGNDDARLRNLSERPGEENRIDYNASMLFENGEMTELYRKLHLVPFTEHFPYEKQLPWIHQALLDADTHFWEKGTEAYVFNSRGLKFSTPICFEDIFGYLSREFVRNGAQLIVNMSNDAWSASLPAQNQHLSMAVFRAVENRRAMVRSTASGQTCAVDPNGKILAMAEPFTEAWIASVVPVIQVTSFYTLYGDWFPVLCITLAIVLLIIGLTFVIMRKVKSVNG